MDSIQETEKSLRKFLEPSQKKNKSYLYWQFIGIWKILWRTIMESSNLNTSSIPDKWYCWKCGTQNKRRDTSVVLLQSGLDEKWWADSMECYCYLQCYVVCLWAQAVIKMIINGRSPTMRHVSRTHRVALDWLFDRINLDPNIQIKYVHTKKPTRRHTDKGQFHMWWME